MIKQKICIELIINRLINLVKTNKFDSPRWAQKIILEMEEV